MFPLQQYIFRIFHCLEYNQCILSNTISFLTCQWSRRGQFFLTSCGKFGVSSLYRTPRPAIPVHFSVRWHLPYIIEIRMFTPNNSSMPLLTLWLMQNNYSEYDVTEPDISTGDKLFQREGSSLHSWRLNHQGSFWPCGSLVF